MHLQVLSLATSTSNAILLDLGHGFTQALSKVLQLLLARGFIETALLNYVELLGSWTKKPDLHCRDMLKAYTSPFRECLRAVEARSDAYEGPAKRQ